MALTIAGLQTAGTPGDVTANLDELRRAARAARSRGAHLLITPELFVTGYDIGDRVRDLATQDLTGQVRRIAAEEGVAVLAGLPEQVGEQLHNSAVLIDRTGRTLSIHRKTHLYGELDRRYFVAGDRGVTTAELQGVRIATLICYDVEFPENVRAAALAGAHLVAVPTAQMTPFAFIAEHVVRTRAWENQVYLAYVNHDGAEDTLQYVGRSSIVAPDGQVVDGVEHGTRLLLATIDPAVVAAARKANPYLADRRPDLYR